MWGVIWGYLGCLLQSTCQHQRAHSLSSALTPSRSHSVFLRAEFKTHSLCASLPRHVPIPAPWDSISLGLCFLLWEMEEYQCPSHRVAMTRQGTRTYM